jgi:simple sugar transport system permease protein
MTPPTGTSWHAGLPPAARQLLWPTIALVLLFLFNVLFTENFLQITIGYDGRATGQLISIVRSSAVYALLALGMTLVIATGGIDLSVGSTMALAGVIAASLVTPEWFIEVLGVTPEQAAEIDTGSLMWFVLLLSASLIAAAIAGTCNGLLVSVMRVQPIIATLISMVVIRGIAQLLCGGTIYTYTGHAPRLEYIGQGVFLALPFSVWMAGLMVVVTWAMTRLTALGLMIESVGDNDRASHFTGLRSRTIRLLAYVFAGLCAGVAGLIESSNVASADPINIGVMFELDAIFAVVVGGTALTGGRFYLFGSVLGALLIATLYVTLVTQGVPAPVTPIPKALVIIAVCLLQSPAFRKQVFRPFAALRVKGAPT